MTLAFAATVHCSKANQQISCLGIFTALIFFFSNCASAKVEAACVIHIAPAVKTHYSAKFGVIPIIPIPHPKTPHPEHYPSLCRAGKMWICSVQQ